MLCLLLLQYISLNSRQKQYYFVFILYVDMCYLLFIFCTRGVCCGLVIFIDGVSAEVESNLYHSCLWLQ